MKSIEHCKEQEKQFISIDFSLPGSNQPHGESIIQEHYGVPFGHRVTLFTNQRNPLEPNIPQTCIVGLHTFWHHPSLLCSFILNFLQESPHSHDITDLSLGTQRKITQNKNNLITHQAGSCIPTSLFHGLKRRRSFKRFCLKMRFSLHKCHRSDDKKRNLRRGLFWVINVPGDSR